MVAFDEEGEHSDGYVLGAIYNNKDTPPVASKDKFFVRFEDGTEIEYDKKTHILRVKAQTVIIEGNVNVIGSIHVTGSIIDEGGNTPHHSH